MLQRKIEQFKNQPMLIGTVVNRGNYGRPFRKLLHEQKNLKEAKE